MIGRCVATLLVALASVAVVAGVGYTTGFPLAEDTISEGNRWINGRTAGAVWSDVRTTRGLAFGTQTGSGMYDDSLAILRGTWGPNQSASATVRSVNQRGGNVFEEVELLLRWSLIAHSAWGYEINFRALNSSESYTEIVRWNGRRGDFTYLSQRRGGAYGIKNGDLVKATVAGNVITAYINGVAVASASDSTYRSGNPGMGFFLQGATGVNRDYGFTTFSASDGGATEEKRFLEPAGSGLVNMATAVETLMDGRRLRGLLGDPLRPAHTTAWATLSQ